MNYTVLTRAQDRSGVRGHRVPAIDASGTTLAVRCDVPPRGTSRRRSLRLTRKALERRYPDRAWPDEQSVHIKVPDWRWPYAVAALCALAGLIAGAWPYALALAAICAALALSAIHVRVHAIDRFDPAVRRGFAAMLRDNLANTARLYLLPLGAVLALHLVLAAVLGSFVAGAKAQSTIRTAQSFLDGFAVAAGKLKLEERYLVLVLLAVWLVTCLLAAAGAPRVVAGWLNGIVRGYARYSGPVVATVTALSLFTLLTGTASTLRGQIDVSWTADEDYQHAAAVVEEQLTAQVLDQVVAAMRQQMPSDYQQLLAGSISVQIAVELERIRAADGEQARDDPLIAAEQDRASRRAALPSPSVITAYGDIPPYQAPDDLTRDDAEAARRWADIVGPAAPTSLATDAGKDVLIQMPKVATEWAVWKELGNTYPEAKPLIDAVAEVLDAQLQDRLRAQVPPILRKISARSGDVQTAMSTAVRDLVASIDIPVIVRNHADQARQAVAAAREVLKALTTKRQRAEGHQGPLFRGRPEARGDRPVKRIVTTVSVPPPMLTMPATMVPACVRYAEIASDEPNSSMAPIKRAHAIRRACRASRAISASRIAVDSRSTSANCLMALAGSSPGHADVCSGVVMVPGVGRCPVRLSERGRLARVPTRS
jgi:hypothetical protein